jgi:hypothetical protein
VKDIREDIMADELDAKQLQELIFSILMIERKNARSREKSDSKMSEEIQKIIVDYSKNMLTGD